jgi:putative copper resistance protein D
MAIAVGLAIALSRSPTPQPRTVADTSAAKAALGFDLPPPISLGRLAFDWAPEIFFAVFIVVAAFWYGRAVHRLQARGDMWPRLYTAAWYAGLVVVLVTTQSGISRYGQVLFSVHMAQHMLLSMVAPPLLALGAPITLALRYWPAKGPQPGARGARAWLLAILRTPVFRVLSHPLVGLGLFVVSTFGLYFSGLFAALMANHAGHLFMLAHFLITGCLVFWPLVSPDPLPHRPGHGARMLLLVILVPFHAFFGLAILTNTHVLASSWFERLGRTWGASPLNDQRTGGGIAMALAEPVAFLVIGVILLQWSRADERQARAFDRKADRREGDPEHDELAAYNRYLADLAKRR